MNLNRKYLKNISIIVLILAGIYLINLVTGIFFDGLNQAAIPEDAPENILQITQIFVLVMSLLFLWPQIYVGVKGLKVANEPNDSKGHIVWAIILLVIAAWGVVSGLFSMIGDGVTLKSIFDIAVVAVETVLYSVYIKFARAIYQAKR